jgi:osmotically-inducible protein OsmY
MHTKRVIMMAFLIAGATALPGYAAEPAAAGTPDSVQPSDASVRVVASSNSDDLQVTAQIRQALAADPSLSDLAHNVQVATNSDAVILRGVVEPTEKDRVNTLAQQFAGARQIMDELTVRARE